MKPTDPKLSDGGPGAGAVSTAALGEGAGCAGASWRAAQPVTEPVGPKPPPLLETDMTAVRCSAWLGVAGVGMIDIPYWWHFLIMIGLLCLLLFLLWIWCNLNRVLAD